MNAYDNGDGKEVEKQQQENFEDNSEMQFTEEERREMKAKQEALCDIFGIVIQHASRPAAGVVASTESTLPVVAAEASSTPAPEENSDWILPAMRFNKRQIKNNLKNPPGTRYAKKENDDAGGAAHTAAANNVGTTQQLEQALETLCTANNAPALQQASIEAPRLVLLESNPQWFLPAHVQTAAGRVASYWQQRLKIFGPRQAFLPLTAPSEQHDEEKDEQQEHQDGSPKRISQQRPRRRALSDTVQQGLECGAVCILPGTDMHGRPVVLVDLSCACTICCQRSTPSFQHHAQMAFWILQLLLESPAARSNGIVIILCLSPQIPPSTRSNDGFWMLLQSQAFPIKIRAIHVCMLRPPPSAVGGGVLAAAGSSNGVAPISAAPLAAFQLQQTLIQWLTVLERVQNQDWKRRTMIHIADEQDSVALLAATSPPHQGQSCGVTSSSTEESWKTTTKSKTAGGGLTIMLSNLLKEYGIWPELLPRKMGGSLSYHSYVNQWLQDNMSGVQRAEVAAAAATAGDSSGTDTADEGNYLLEEDEDMDHTEDHQQGREGGDDDFDDDGDDDDNGSNDGGDDEGPGRGDGRERQQPSRRGRRRGPKPGPLPSRFKNAQQRMKDIRYHRLKRLRHKKYEMGLKKRVEELRELNHQLHTNHAMLQAAWDRAVKVVHMYERGQGQPRDNPVATGTAASANQQQQQQQPTIVAQRPQQQQQGQQQQQIHHHIFQQQQNSAPLGNAQASPGGLQQQQQQQHQQQAFPQVVSQVVACPSALSLRPQHFQQQQLFHIQAPQSAAPPPAVQGFSSALLDQLQSLLNSTRVGGIASAPSYPQALLDQIQCLLNSARVGSLFAAPSLPQAMDQLRGLLNSASVGDLAAASSHPEALDQLQSLLNASRVGSVAVAPSQLQALEQLHSLFNSTCVGCLVTASPQPQALYPPASSTRDASSSSISGNDQTPLLSLPTIQNVMRQQLRQSENQQHGLQQQQEALVRLIHGPGYQSQRRASAHGDDGGDGDGGSFDGSSATTGVAPASQTPVPSLVLLDQLQKGQSTAFSPLISTSSLLQPPPQQRWQQYVAPAAGPPPDFTSSNGASRSIMASAFQSQQHLCSLLSQHSAESQFAQSPHVQQQQAPPGLLSFVPQQQQQQPPSTAVAQLLQQQQPPARDTTEALLRLLNQEKDQ